MQYVSLKKYFHIDENKCNELYKKRLESESCRRLAIKINHLECFYVVTEEMLNLMTDIYSINTWLEKILGSESLPSMAQYYLIIKSLIEEIKSSNKMEGIYSTRKEIEEMIHIAPPKKYKRFYGMVNKYSKLINEEFDGIESCLDIRELYNEILLGDVINENKKDAPDGIIFRKESVSIDSGTRIIHKGIEGESHIIEMMDKSLKILNDESIALLIRVAIFHYLFEYIHPFYNGNGRMGRFLASGYLSKEFNILCALQLSIACSHDSKKYYDAFELTNDVRNKSDLTVFIIRFLEIYLSGLKELKESIEYTMDIYVSLKEKMNHFIDDKYKDFMEFLLEVTLFGPNGGISMAELVQITSKTQQTLRSHIKAINKDYHFIDVESSHKPYMYKIDIDAISSLKK